MNNWLKSLGAGGPLLCILVISLIGVATSASFQRKNKVLILGAGVAGITAAKTLYTKGIDDFLVLEGQDYIGGRMKSVPFAKIKVEEGANWVHYYDENPNPIKILQKREKYPGTMSNFSALVMRNDNGDDITNYNLLNQWDDALENLMKMADERSDKGQPDMPLAVGLDLLGYKVDTPLKQALVWYDIDFEFGNDQDETSLNNMAGGLSEADFFLTGQKGYWSLFEDFYSDFPEKILLNKPVTKIKYSSNGVEVTAGGEVYTADYAISTFSNGVLGSGMVKFVPQLPDWKREAIYRMHMVFFTKIFLKFPEDFWDDSEWILHAGKKRGYYVPFFDLDRPGFFPGSKMLFSCVTGDMALEVEKQSDKKTLEDIMEVLRGMYGPHIPNATDIHVSKWSRNKFTQGSFSDAVIGTGDQAYKDIACPLERLFFAGEGTSDEWYGYVQGGYYTGMKQARAVASCIKRKCKQSRCNRMRRV